MGYHSHGLRGFQLYLFSQAPFLANTPYTLPKAHASRQVGNLKVTESDIII